MILKKTFHAIWRLIVTIMWSVWFTYWSKTYITDFRQCWMLTVSSSFLFIVGVSLQWSSFSPFRLISLGFVVLYVFALSFGPFIYLVCLPQITIEIEIGMWKELFGSKFFYCHHTVSSTGTFFSPETSATSFVSVVSL